MEWGERGDEVALSDNPKRKKSRVVLQLHSIDFHSVNIVVIFVCYSFFSREQVHLPEGCGLLTLVLVDNHLVGRQFY